MKKIITLLFLSLFAFFANANNYDTARKIYEMGKEVETYQKSKLDGTHKDYSVTPNWVISIWSLVGVIALGLGCYVIYSLNTNNNKTKNDDLEIKNPDISEILNIQKSIENNCGGEYIENIACKSIKEIQRLADRSTSNDDFWNLLKLSMGREPIFYSWMRSCVEKFPTSISHAISHTLYYDLYTFFYHGKNLGKSNFVRDGILSKSRKGRRNHRRQKLYDGLPRRTVRFDPFVQHLSAHQTSQRLLN